MGEFRTEKDSMGEMQVPANAYYGASTQRAVLNFPVTRMPSVGQTLFIYRDGLKVGEIKVTGPIQDDNIVGDLVNGEGKTGDEVRDR